MYLSEVPIVEQEVGYGSLGIRGELGYEGLRVSVRGQQYEHALSAHAPSCLIFDLDGRFSWFRSYVALNGDVPARRSYADFTVLANGRAVAAMPNVGAGDPPREIVADISGATQLALIVDTNHWDHCHSLWLDPELRVEGTQPRRVLIDALARAEIKLPAEPLRAQRCVATVVSPAYAHLLDGMLGSLEANGRCDDALKVVFAIDADDECRRVVTKHGATAIDCRPLARMNPGLKAVMYSIARVVDASQFLCLDADTLILDDLSPIFATLEACPRRSILVCPDAFLGQGNLKRELCTHYAGRHTDIEMLLGRQFNEASYPLAVNDGVFAGSRGALLALDNLIRNLPNAVAWVDQYPDHGWRNQFIFNLALARMNCGIELDPSYNLQLHMRDVLIRKTDGRVDALWRGQPVHILHFCGWGRDKHPELRGLFSKGRQTEFAEHAARTEGVLLDVGAST